MSDIERRMLKGGTSIATGAPAIEPIALRLADATAVSGFSRSKFIARRPTKNRVLEVGRQDLGRVRNRSRPRSHDCRARCRTSPPHNPEPIPADPPGRLTPPIPFTEINAPIRRGGKAVSDPKVLFRQLATDKLAEKSVSENLAVLALAQEALAARREVMHRRMAAQQARSI